MDLPFGDGYSWVYHMIIDKYGFTSHCQKGPHQFLPWFTGGLGHFQDFWSLFNSENGLKWKVPTPATAKNFDEDPQSAHFFGVRSAFSAVYFESVWAIWLATPMSNCSASRIWAFSLDLRSRPPGRCIKRIIEISNDINTWPITNLSILSRALNVNNVGISCLNLPTFYPIWAP